MSREEALRKVAPLLSEAEAQYAKIEQMIAAVNDVSVRASLGTTALQISAQIVALQNAHSPADIQKAVAALQSAVSSGEKIIAAAKAAEGMQATLIQNINITAAAAREETQRIEKDIFDNHAFDKDLHFTSEQDKANFEEEQKRSRQYIDEQLAKKTPEGDYNATGAARGALVDIAAHNGDKSDKFKEDWDKLTQKDKAERAALIAAGKSSELAEHDRYAKEKVRNFLRSKGKTDTEIDQLLAKTSDPYEAAAPFIGKDMDSIELRKYLASVATQSSTTDISKEMSSSVAMNTTASTASLKKEKSQADPKATAMMAAMRAAEKLKPPNTDPVALNVTDAGNDQDAPLNGKPGEIALKIDKLKSSGLQIPDDAQITVDGHGLAVVQKLVIQQGQTIV